MRDEITERECERIGELSDRGWSYREIAEEMECSKATVATHRNEQCSHYAPDACPECGADVNVLAHHLMAEHLVD